MRNDLMAACLSLALLTSCGAPAVVQPQPGPAEAEKPAVSPEMVAPTRAFVRLWEKPGYFEQLRFVTLSGKTLYLGGGPRGLEAVDVETGATLWYHTGDFPPDFPPFKFGDILYVVEGGRLVALDAAKGTLLSRVHPRQGFLTPPFPTSRYVVFASGDEYAYAVTLDTGAKMWHDALDGYPISSAWNGGAMAYIMTSNGTLYAIAMSPLGLSWNRNFSFKDCSAPVLVGKTIYIGSADYYLYALSASIGDVEWKTSLSAPVLETPLVAPPRVYAGTTERLIHAVDLATHKDLWAIPGDRALTTTADHVLFQRTINEVNWIGMADAATGKLISEMTAADYVMFAGSPDGGVVYAVGKKGNVLAIGDRAMVEARNAAKEAERMKAAETPPVAPTATPAPATTAAPTPPPATPAPAATATPG